MNLLIQLLHDKSFCPFLKNTHPGLLFISQSDTQVIEEDVNRNNALHTSQCTLLEHGHDPEPVRSRLIAVCNDFICSHNRDGAGRAAEKSDGASGRHHTLSGKAAIDTVPQLAALFKMTRNILTLDTRCCTVAELLAVVP